jgi:hypothetical protein
VGLRAGLDAAEKRKVMLLPGIEPQQSSFSNLSRSLVRHILNLLNNDDIIEHLR